MHVRKFFTVLFIVLALGGMAVSLTTAQEAPTVTTSGVYRFGDFSEVEGGFSRLSRFDNGVTMMLDTNDLTAGAVYTAWWVVFNAPENCSDNVCNEDDIFVVEDETILRDEIGNRAVNMDAVANANVSVLHASGSYATDGHLYVSASLGEGEVPGIVFGPGLLDAETAEIHLVVRTHGSKIDDIYADQISTFGGGCDPIDAPPCIDEQFAVHLPVSQ